MTSIAQGVREQQTKVNRVGPFGLPALKTPFRISPDNPHVTRVGEMVIRPKGQGEKEEEIHFYRLNWVPGLSSAHRFSRIRQARRAERDERHAKETRDAAARVLNQLRYFHPDSRQPVEVLRRALEETRQKEGRSEERR